MSRLTLTAFSLFTLVGTAFSQQTMTIDFAYPTSTYSGSDIWVTFENSFSGATGIAGTYVNGISGLTESLNVIYSGTYQYVQSGSTYTSGQTSYWTQSLNLAQLSTGVTFTSGQSMRAYISIGSPLVFSGSGVTGGLLSFGAPSYSNPSDPNWNIRWDVAEITISNPASTGDQGDVTAINGIAIPMQMTSYTTSGSVAYTTQTSTNFNALLQALNGPGGYYEQNAANNTNPGVTPSNPYVTGTNGEFIRAIGLNNGAHAEATQSAITGGTAYASNDNAVATIGANNTFGNYVNSLAQNGTTTPLADRQVNVIGGNFYAFSSTLSGVAWDPNGTYSATWTNASSGTSSGTFSQITVGGTGSALQVSGDFLVNSNSIGSFTVIIPPDNVVTGSGTSNYILTNTITAGDPSANYGLIFKFTPTGGSEMTFYNYNDFVAAVNRADALNNGQGAALIQQVFHDLSAGMNFGLVGSTAIDPITGQNLNDEGSQAWTDVWETIAHGGSYDFSGTTYTQANAPTLPLYEAAQGSSNGYYNQWAALIYASSTTAYGNPYSDYLQAVDVNLQGTGTNFNISHTTITLFPDEVPEPSTYALIIIAVGAFLVASWKLPRSMAK